MECRDGYPLHTKEEVWVEGSAISPEIFSITGLQSLLKWPFSGNSLYTLLHRTGIFRAHQKKIE